MALNRGRVSSDIGLSNSLYYVVDVDYFDSAVPATILWHETFVLPRGSTTAQLQAKVIERGTEIRAAFAARDAARISVPNQTTITVP